MTTEGFLVVGAKGFLGSAIRRELGNAPGLVNVTSEEPLQAHGDSSLRNVKAVMWAASGVTPAVAAEYPHLANQEVEYFRQSIDRIVSLSPGAAIILASSGGTVYRPGTPPFTENSKTGTEQVYGAMKIQMEEIAAAQGGISLRFANLYGPHQVPRRGLGVIPHWLNAALHQQPLVIYGDGSAARDYLDVSDGAVAAVTAMCAGRSISGPINIGSGQSTSLNELLDLVQATVSPMQVTVQRHEARSFDQGQTWLDCSRARELLGWEPSIGLVEGLARTWSHLRAAAK